MRKVRKTYYNEEHLIKRNTVSFVNYSPAGWWLNSVMRHRETGVNNYQSVTDNYSVYQKHKRLREK